MTRVSVLLASVSAMVLSSGLASAQTLSDFNPQFSCSGPGLEDFKASGGCDPNSPIAKTIVDSALTQAAVWEVIFASDHEIGYTRLGGVDAIFAVSPNEPMSDITRRAMNRAQGPAFYDPFTGTILINADTVFQSVIDDTLDVSLSRALGMAIVSSVPAASALLNSDDVPPVMLTVFEGFAGLPDIAESTGSPEISLSRDFSLPIFGELDKATSWGTFRFWANAIKRTAIETPSSLEQAAEVILLGLTDLSDEPAVKPDFVSAFMDGWFDTLGWDRFKHDGMSYVYAEIMAEHMLDKEHMQTPVEDIFYIPGLQEMVIEGELPAGYASAFYSLELEGSQLRNSWVEIEACYYEDTPDSCDLTDGTIHLGIAGVIASRPTGPEVLELPNGTLVERPRRNTVRSDTVTLNQLKGDDGSLRLPLSISATPNTAEPVKYLLKIRGAEINPPCSWASMVSTLNPWWRGNLSAADALIPNTKDIPPDMRASISEGLSGQWYLTEESYRKDIDWDQSIFAGAVGQERLGKVRNFLTDEQIEEAISLESGITASQADSAFSFLMPSQARVSITGAFSDGGDVCVSPVAVSEMPDMGQIPDMAGQDMGSILAEMGLPPELATARSEAEVLAIVMGTRGALEELEPKKDVMLQIFSPNLWTQQSGMLLPGAAKPLSHSGANGWRRNAGMNLYVRLPGTSPDDLKPGRYRATATVQLFQDLDDTGFTPDRALPFYVRGWGAAEKTQFEDFIENGLSGWLTIERQTFGAATASLELSGQTWKYASPKPGEKPEEAEPAGPVQFRINRFLMLGLSEDEPVPVMNPLNLVTAQIPTPD